MLWGNKKAKKYSRINKLHDIHKNEVDTLSRQNAIHICTPCFLFWPGSVKNEGSILHPKPRPMIQWKSCHKISKICWHLENSFFDSTIDSHVQHGLWLYQLRNNRCWWQWGNTGGRLSQCYSNEAALCRYPLAGLLLGQQQWTSCPVKLFSFREGSHLFHQLPVLGLWKQMSCCVRN